MWLLEMPPGSITRWEDQNQQRDARDEFDAMLIANALYPVRFSNFTA